MKYLKLFENFDYKEFKETDSYKKGDYFQSIMDVGYNAWKKSENRTIDYMFEYMDKNYGSDFSMMIRIGNYIYQVNNGGHSQYYQNGYASVNVSGYNNQNKDVNNLRKMINQIKKSFLYTKYPITKKVVNIMIKALNYLEEYNETCTECGGTGSIEETCYDCRGSGEDDNGESCDMCDGMGEIEVQCDNCDGQGYIQIELDQEDDEYHSLDEKFEKACNDFSEKLIKSYYDKINLFKSINR